MIVSRLRLKCTRLARLRTCPLSRDTACIVNPTSDVAERCYHLCSGAFNYFAHPGVDVPRANVLLRTNGQVVLSGKTVYPYLKLPDDLAVNDAMLNEGGDSAYNPVALDDNTFPSLPPLDPSREHAITDSIVPVTLRPAEAPSITRHPIVPPPTRAQVGPVSLRLRLALDLLREHPLPVIDLSRLWFPLRIRLVPLAAPRLPMLRPVHPLPRRALQTCRRITYRIPTYCVARTTVLLFYVRRKQASAMRKNMLSTARQPRLVNILLLALAAPQRTGDTTFNIVMFVY